MIKWRCRMKLSINIKGLSRRKVIHQEEIEIENEISTTKDLIRELVKINVEKFNKKIDDKDILSIMTNEHIAEAARSGKIGDEVHGDKKANLEKALDTAYLAFEDGLYCIFINDEQSEKLDDSLNLKDGDILTFIRLTMLAGRMCYNSYVSSFLYNRGNPYITPQLTDEWNTLATYGPVSASVTYSHIHKGIYADYQLSSINSNAVEKILRNYDDFSLLKCALNAQKQIGKWMSKLTLTYEKPFADKVFYKSQGLFSVEWMNQITPSENWLFLVMLLYKSKGSMQEAYIYKPVSGVFVGVGRAFFHQSLSVYAVASDFYNGLNRHARIQNSYISNSTAYSYSNFSFKIGISYNFNTTQSKYKGKEISEEENNRM